MAKAEAAEKIPAPFAIRDAPMEIGELDLSAWLPPAPPRESMTGSAAAIAPVVMQDSETLASLAIEVWRLKGRLGRLRELVPAKELRPVESAVGKMEEALTQASVELDDPQGRPFHEGEPLEVLLFEPSPGLARPTVLQTVKPLVRVNGKLARRGEVVVGTPGPASGEGPKEGAK